MTPSCCISLTSARAFARFFTTSQLRVDRVRVNCLTFERKFYRLHRWTGSAGAIDAIHKRIKMSAEAESVQAPTIRFSFKGSHRRRARASSRWTRLPASRDSWSTTS
jgi:hypothetical protein